MGLTLMPPSLLGLGTGIPSGLLWGLALQVGTAGPGGVAGRDWGPQAEPTPSSQPGGRSTGDRLRLSPAGWLEDENLGRDGG